MKLIPLTEAPVKNQPGTPAPVLSDETKNKISAGNFKDAYYDVAGTPLKELFFDEYLKKKFAGKEDKIKDFKEQLITLLVALEFEDNPIIDFLVKYLDIHNMTKSGFITLNNLYATGMIDDVDFISSNITPILFSDIFVSNSVANAEFIIQTYQNLLEGSYDLNFLNIDEMNRLVKEKMPEGTNPKELLKYKDNGVVPDEKRKTLVDLVIFEAGQADKKVDKIENIKKAITNLKAKNLGAVKKDTSRVTLNMAPSIEQQQKSKLKNMIKDLKKEEVPALLRTLKDDGLLD